jgi:hypothetical protein
MLPSITPTKSPSLRVSTGNQSVAFEKTSVTTSPGPSPQPMNALVSSPSSIRASPAISAIMKTPAVSANFAVYASPERKQRIDVQAMLNEIHSRPSMAGMLGTGIVSALSAKTISDTQTSKPLEVRANLDRFIRSKLQVELRLTAKMMLLLINSCRMFAPSRMTSSSLWATSLRP